MKYDFEVDSRSRAQTCTNTKNILSAAEDVELVDDGFSDVRLRIRTHVVTYSHARYVFARTLRIRTHAVAFENFPNFD